MSLNSKGSLNKQMKLKRPQNAVKQQQQMLKSQTSKIQNKLESLKAEIAMRKTMKNKQKQADPQSLKSTQKNNTGQSWNTTGRSTTQKQFQQTSANSINKFLAGTKTPNQSAQQSQDAMKLQRLLQQLKMDQYKETIKQNYAINGIKKLLQLSQDDVDKWKTIPVGFRIKIKKFIKEHDKNKQQEAESKQQQTNSDDIEAIIQRRKIERIFQPICDKKLQQYQQQQPMEILDLQYLEEKDKNKRPKKEQYKDQKSSDRIQSQQDILISSLNQAFLQRKSIIKKQGFLHESNSSIKNKEGKNKVHWDANVKQYNKQSSNFKGQALMTKYPSEMINKHEGEGYLKVHANKVKYCWNCFKKVQKLPQQQLHNQPNTNKVFCSISCEQKYSQLMEPGSLQSRLSNINKIGQNKKTGRQDDNKQQLEIIDLDLV